jgi:hypothetical protein
MLFIARSGYSQKSIVLAGSSITAKIEPHPALKRDGYSIINMGIDGGSSLYAARKVSTLKDKPRFILIEANTVLKPINSNNINTLNKASDSVFLYQDTIFRS